MEQLPEIGRKVRFVIPNPEDVDEARLDGETGRVFEHFSLFGKPTARVRLDNEVRGHHNGTAWGRAPEFEYVDETEKGGN